MKFIEYINETSINTLWYHGSGMEFNEFKTDVDSSTGIAHHGYGTYLVDNPETARKYVEMYAVGQHGILYSCRIPSNLNIVKWDDMIPLAAFTEMAEEIEEFDESLAEEMKEYPEAYHGETFTYGELYNVLKNVEEYKNPNEFFQGYYVDGFLASNRIDPDSKECCIFDNTSIKIINKEQVV